MEILLVQNINTSDFLPFVFASVLRVKAVLFRDLIIRIFRRLWEVNIMKGFMNLLVKSGPGNLNRQEERDLKQSARVRRGSRARAPRPP